MKIMGLCFLSFLCFTAVSSAQESSKPSSAQLADPNPPATVERRLLADRAGLAIIDRGFDTDGGSKTCAYMRTYRVKREVRDSDAVRPAGYTTCVPSKRFEVKSAVQVEPQVAPRE